MPGRESESKGYLESLPVERPIKGQREKITKGRFTFREVNILVIPLLMAHFKGTNEKGSRS